MYIVKECNIVFLYFLMKFSYMKTKLISSNNNSADTKRNINILKSMNMHKLFSIFTSKERLFSFNLCVKFKTQSRAYLRYFEKFF